MILSKLRGVPVKLDVKEVIFAAWAVIVTASQLSVLMAGVAEETIVVIRCDTLLLVKVWVAAMVETVSELDGKANEVLSVPVRVSVLLEVNVFPSATTSVLLVAGGVIVILLTEVGVIAPATMVSAGVAPPLELPENPFAVAIDTAVTVPALVEVRVPPESARPVPTATSLNVPELSNPAKVLAVFVATETVPDEVIGPPVSPVPVFIWVTVPDPPPPPPVLIVLLWTTGLPLKK